MSDDSPYFFFSYAHDDDDAYLKKFFKDLQSKVSQLHREPRTGAFRDANSIDAGDDWSSKISKALQTSQVLVCIYTARFFGRKYCGKEFAAFLKRNELRYERVPDDAAGTIDYQVREVPNILPILWLGEDALNLDPDPKKKLPPHIVRSIHYAMKEKTDLATRETAVSARVAKEYLEKGLWRLCVNPRSATRADVINYFATKIVTAKPLPSPEEPFTFEELWDAFSEIPDGHGAEHAATGAEGAEPSVAAPEAVSPLQAGMLAIEITPASEGSGSWVPYAGGPALAAAVREIAHDDRSGFSHLALDPNSVDFEAKAWSAVEDATLKAAMPILFVNPRCLEQHRSAIAGLQQRKWSGGIILPADRSDQEAVRLVRDSLPDLQRPGVEGARIVVRPSIGTMDTFRTAVNSVALQTFGKITETGQVQRKPLQQEGPEVRPRITNFLNPGPSGASSQ